MGFFGKLAGLGAVVGATFAAVKVAQKYNENKTKQGDYIKPVREESIQEVLGDVKKAAIDVYSETSEKLKTSVEQAAGAVGIDTTELGEKVGAAGKAVAEAGNKVIDKIGEEAPKVAEKAKETAEKVKSKAKSTKSQVAAKADDVADAVEDAVEQAVKE